MKSKRALSLLLALVFVLTLLPAVSPAALAATEIDSVSVTLDVPAVGAHPDYTAAFPSGAHYYSDAYNENYYRNDMIWQDVTDDIVEMNPDSDVFQAGHEYRVWVYLTAQDGYEFSSSTTAAVNGQTVETGMYNSQLRFGYVFPALQEEGIVASGILDSGVYWKLDDKGTLTYFGNGEVNAPLTDAQMDYHYFKDVIIEEGVTKYDVEYDDSDYTIPESITAKGHLTDFDVESEYHYGYHIGSRRLSNIYFQGAAPDSISYSSSEEVTIWYDPDMSGWTQELIDQLSQNPNITVKATGSPVITSYGNVGYGEGSPAVTFSVEAEGKGTLSYQWFTRESGSSIWNEVTAASGKTADYTFTPSRELELFCRVSNYLGSVDSPVMCLKKVIFSQPTDQTVYAGEEVSFSVRAGGVTGSSYQWYYLEPGSSEWIEVSENGSSNTYTFTAYGRFNGRQYRCRVYGSTVDSSGYWHSYPAYSSAAALTVISPPAITTQPTAQSVTAGAAATFMVVASGTGLTYQWQKSADNGSTWSNISGATSASYTLTTKESDNGALYRCVVKNAGGKAVSGTAKLTVTAAKPTITTQPAAQSVTAGTAATFMVVASGTGLTYQWQKSADNGSTWSNISGAASASYTLTAKESDNGTLFRCVVKNAGGKAVSGTAKLTVTAAKPTITTQPAAQSVTAGAAATFMVVASGTGLTYQWQKSADNGSTWSNISGATAASYTLTTKEADNGALFRCVVKNTGGKAVSGTAKLTVTAAAPAITTQPAAQSVTAGAAATFKVVASGTGLTYQWQKSADNGSTWTNISGATADSYTLTAKESDSGTLYRCVVKNAGGKAVSGTAKLTVTAAALVISSIKANVTSAKTGETITWTAKAAGGSGTLQYYFILYKDGTKLKTQAYSTMNTFSYTPKGAGTFKVKVYVKDAADTKVNKTSAGVTVTSAAPVISSVKEGVTSAYAGEKITWTAAASGGSGTLKYYFILYKDGTKIKTRSYSTANTFSYTPMEAGSYKVKVYVKDSTGAKSYKTSGKIAVTLGPPAIISVKAGKTSSGVGEKITWTATAVGSEQPLKYYFILYKNGKKIKTQAYSTKNTFSYTPKGAGTYKVKVYVKDAAGEKVYKTSAKITVS